MIAVGNKKKKNTDGIIVIICLCYNCWGEIAVYPYFICINALFGLMKQNDVLGYYTLYRSSDLAVQSVLAKEHENEQDEEFKEDTSQINDTNESKFSKYKTKEALITSMLAKIILPKVTQAFIFSINTYEQDMISFGNDYKKINNKDRWNYCHHMPHT